MPTNYLTQFATSGTANLPTESTWQNLTERATGFQTGLARSSYFNRLFAQGANAAYVIGQMVVDYASQDADLDGATLYTNFKTAMSGYIGGSFLPKSGGTMTGAITKSGTLLAKSSSDNSYVEIDGGTDYNKGAYLRLEGKDSSNAGQARLTCTDGANTYSLILDPATGTAQWRSGALLTTHLANVVSAGNWIYKNNGTSYLRISGGSSASTGGNVVFRGESASSNAGGVELWAGDGNNTAEVLLLPDSNMTIASKHICYGKGTHTLTNMSAYGYVTSGGTAMTLLFPFKVAGTVAATGLTTLTASVRRGTGGYTNPGGETSASLIPSGVTKTIGIREQHMWVTLVRSAGWGATNNETVVAASVSITFTVT